MSKTKPIRKAAREGLRAEARIPKAFEPYQDALWMQAITQAGKLGDQPELRTLSGVVIAGGVIAGNGRLVRAGFRMLFAHELATAAKDVIKRRLERTRPRSADSQSQRKVKVGDSTAKEETSFPSGHSAGATAVARAFSREYPKHQGPALAAAGVVAAAQVPRCAHYPTDVAAGIALGALAEKVTDLLIRGVDRRARQN